MNKPDQPIQSARTRKLFADNYAVAFAGQYFGMRTIYLARARYTQSPATRDLAIEGAKRAHRDYLRCLREAKREASLPVPQLLRRQA